MKKIIIIFMLLTAGYAQADCFDEAAAYHGVNPWVLRGIAQVESGFNPKAINKNKNGTTDIGMMQINSIHLRRLGNYGIRRDDLFQACHAIHVGAFLLREKLDKHGNTWIAIGAYHSETPFYRDRYAERVRKALRKWNKL